MSWEVLVRGAYSVCPHVLTFLRNHFKSSDISDLETATSEAFFSYLIVARDGKLQSDEGAFSFIRKSAYRAVLKQIRRSTHEEHIDDLQFEPAILDASLNRLEIIDALDNILSKLPERDAEVITLYRVEGLSVDEIAAKQNRSVKAVHHSFERNMKKAHDIAIEFGLVSAERTNDERRTTNDERRTTNDELEKA